MLRRFIYVIGIIVLITLTGCTSVDYSQLEEEKQKIIEEVTMLKDQLEQLNLEMESIRNERDELIEIINDIELQVEDSKTDIEILKTGLEIISDEQSFSTEVSNLGETSVPSYPYYSTSDVIESKIDGDFEGWEGDTVFKLTNGQVWVQDSYGFTFRYAFRPDVIIYKSGSRYKMSVEGVSDTIYVRRIN